ncbi:hypothetical protein HK105_203683 [Polyrhizophydium stewartii]|uniref:HMG box domain-containing protein n=1 Tax=Polyrhizophydium stewartii TaxID=2732419 RepID=A0ABR4NBQ2_9FUNG|nr:high mobility group box 3 [Polyrhizophydium stewartii]
MPRSRSDGSKLLTELLHRPLGHKLATKVKTALQSLKEIDAMIEAFAPEVHAAVREIETADESDAAGLAPDGKKKRKKREKRIRDPDAPQRPPPSYVLFVKEHYQDVTREFPEMKAKEIMMKLGEMWRNLPTDEKQPFVDQALAERKKYVDDMAIYKDEKKRKIDAGVNRDKAAAADDDVDDDEDDVDSDEEDLPVPSSKIVAPKRPPAAKGSSDSDSDSDSFESESEVPAAKAPPKVAASKPAASKPQIPAPKLPAKAAAAEPHKKDKKEKQPEIPAKLADEDAGDKSGRKKRKKESALPSDEAEAHIKPSAEAGKTPQKPTKGESISDKKAKNAVPPSAATPRKKK